MKPLPNIKSKNIDLYNIITGRVRSDLLKTGIDLGIFDYLEEPVSVEAVSVALDSHVENTGLFLDALTAIGLVEKKDGLYCNSSLSQDLLVQSSETYLGWEVMSIIHSWLPNDDLPGLVKEGPPISPNEDVISGEFWMHMTESLANSERAGNARIAAEVVSGLPEFTSFGKMLDLAGGPGIIGMAIVNEHPLMNGVVFDRPEVVRITEKYIQDYGMESRMSIIGGDYMEDSLGGGYDLVWASACLNFAGERLDYLIARIYNAMNPGGVFVSCAEGLTAERTKPEIRVLENFHRALLGQNFYFNRGEIARSMLRSGFISVQSSPVETNWGVMDIDIARKGE